MERAHATILRDFFQRLSNAPISRILDAGSGKTSLSIITEAFPHAHVNAVIYPGDQRKIQAIQPMLSQNCQAVEADICAGGISGTFDLTVAHLLLGEAAKFGNSFLPLLENLLDINSRYFILIDYLEDPGVDCHAIEALCKREHLLILQKACLKNEDPQIWSDFIGQHNFGYLIEKTQYLEHTNL